MINGKIIKGIGGFYYVDTEKGLYECTSSIYYFHPSGYLEKIK